MASNLLFKIMASNLLKALKNIIENPEIELVAKYKSKNRANNMGEALEKYIMDSFCGCFSIKDETIIDNLYSANFSYIGNQNNPPDFIISQGDAVEVKKIQTLKAGIALNSSYPKDKLYCDSPLITKTCCRCEDQFGGWKEKDIIYTIGFTPDNIKLKLLWFVYGNCYADAPEVYEKIKNKITQSFSNSEELEITDTNELGRINKVDTLGITYLRIRGMWHIKNPLEVYRNLKLEQKINKAIFAMIVILKKDKYLSFPEEDRKMLESINNPDFCILDEKIKSPNNPADLIPIKLITFFKS